MPLRCTKCLRVSPDRMCDCDADYFQPCETIHFLHHKGPGPAYSKGKRITKVPGEPPVKDATPLNICCEERQGIEQCTFMASLVSCPKCLEFLDTLRKPKEES